MVFVTDSNSVVTLVRWVGISIIALVLLMMLQVLLMRALLLVRKRRANGFLSVWQPLLLQSLDSAPAEIPPISKTDEVTFLKFWNYLHESLLDESKYKLNQIADLAGVDSIALRMLRRGRAHEQLLGITTLGQLRDKSAWMELQYISTSGHSLLSLAAAKALIRIDAPAALPFLLPLVSLRDDWPLPRVAGMLKEAGPDAISQSLARSALAAILNGPTTNGGPANTSAATAATLIRCLEASQYDSVIPVVREIMSSSQDTEVITACLRAFKEPQDLAMVRSYLNHPEWQIRVQAVTALGRMGTEEDEQRLIDSMCDPEWWVRYRGAQALVGLPSVDAARLKQIQSEQINLFAQDILGQAIAERT